MNGSRTKHISYCSFFEKKEIYDENPVLRGVFQYRFDEQMLAKSGLGCIYFDRKLLNVFWLPWKIVRIEATVDRSYFSDTIEKFMGADPSFIIGNLTRNSQFSILSEQTSAWESEIEILKKSLSNLKGKIYFEYSIPRMGKRIDVLLIIKSAIFILEFKIGEKKFKQSAVDQVWDYALDLKNFHEESHDKFIIPILVSPDAEKHDLTEKFIFAYDKVLNPVKVNAQSLKDKILEVLSLDLGAEIDAVKWEEGRYSPSPSIIEAALSLYNGHSVSEISRKDANAVNLSLTSDFVSKIIEDSRKNSQKSICFVTGVPGAGKTLVGLNIATKYIEKDSELHSVFLSGNGPLVQILHEALARDKYKKEKEKGNKVKKETIKAEVKMFIQNIHHFRDDCLKDMNEPPIEHVVIFDEAQRVWNKEQTVKFMIQKKKEAGLQSV